MKRILGFSILFLAYTAVSAMAQSTVVPANDESIDYSVESSPSE